MPPKPDTTSETDDRTLAELSFRGLVLRVEGGSLNYADLARRSGGKPIWQRWQQLCDPSNEGDDGKFGLSNEALRGAAQALGVSEGVVWSCLGVSRGLQTLAGTRNNALAIFPPDTTVEEARWLAGLQRAARKGPNS